MNQFNSWHENMIPRLLILPDCTYDKVEKGKCELRLGEWFSFNTVILQVDHLRIGTQFKGPSESLALAYFRRTLIIL
jgi:hypothetical protein